MSLILCGSSNVIYGWPTIQESTCTLPKGHSPLFIVDGESGAYNQYDHGDLAALNYWNEPFGFKNAAYDIMLMGCDESITVTMVYTPQEIALIRALAEEVNKAGEDLQPCAPTIVIHSTDNV
jgi:hypothetical protein